METSKKIPEKKNGLVGLPNSPIPLFRSAHENLLIDTETHKRLVDYNKIRSDAAHDYSIEKAIAALNKIEDFVSDAAKIYEQMIKEE